MRPIADTGVLVEFGDRIDDDVHQRVLEFDAAVQQANIAGLTEMLPTYTAIHVGYDPLETDFSAMQTALTKCLNVSVKDAQEPRHWEIPTCYEKQFAPDLDAFCEATGLQPQEVMVHHTSAIFKVYMYGFVPGVAYLGGLPEPMNIPRKQAPVADVPAGSVMVAGSQSLIYTLTMPSGWWNIGRTAKTPLQLGSDQPFIFNVGDSVSFVSVSEAEFLRHQERG